MSLGIIILRIQEGLDYADFFGSLRHSIIDMDDLTTNTADNNNINNTNSNGNMNIKLFQIPEKNDDDDDDDVDNHPHCLDEKVSKTTICLERKLSNTIQSIQQSQQQRILAKKNFEKMKSNKFFCFWSFYLWIFYFVFRSNTT